MKGERLRSRVVNSELPTALLRDEHQRERESYRTKSSHDTAMLPSSEQNDLSPRLSESLLGSESLQPQRVTDQQMQIMPPLGFVLTGNPTVRPLHVRNTSKHYKKRGLNYSTSAFIF